MTILETLLIGPLKLIFEIIFVIAERLIGSPGLAIIALSLVINVMMLPLHARADAMQEESRDKEAKLKPGVDHIKKTFSGDERMMILQTYYRQNDYRPTDVLNGSVSLLLEVPFFMAAYQFLSHLTMLQGVSFGPIADLGAPDGLLVLGPLAINVLPIAMTLINILSGMVYSRGFPLKTKLQMYGLAVFFLVVLYGSPSGLVFYWTLNNLFSLCKNIIRRSKGIRKVGPALLFVAGIGAVIFGTLIYRSVSIKRNLLIVGAGLVLMLPLLAQLLKSKGCLTGKRGSPRNNKNLFFLGSLFMTVLTGMLIPSAYIGASPQEYVNVSYFHDPNLYVLMAVCLAAGTFLIWMRVFYWLASPTGKAVFDKLVWVLCGMMLVNYMFFGRDLGVLQTNLQYAEGMHFAAGEQLRNGAVLVAVAVIMLLVLYKWERTAVTVLLAGTVALGGMAGLNVAVTARETADLKAMTQTGEAELPRFPLSKTGKNVVVIMLDRAMGQMVPYLFGEKPELKDSFDGFIYYDNVISYGASTIFGSSALVGGYEYVPVEMNKRDDVPMVQKHNEALKVLPVLFSDNGYTATLLDPVYANYQWIPDLSAFADYPEIRAYLTNGVFVDPVQNQAQIQANYRNFFCFSIMKSMPLMLQQSIYASGTYNRATTDEDVYSAQIMRSTAQSTGFSPTFMDEYSILCNMQTMTEITEDGVGTYLFMTNNTTHEPMLLQAPGYEPAVQVDNTEYDQAHMDRFCVDSKVLNVHNIDQMAHYHANMAAMMQLGKWFDYLRQNGVYDNTRIILVSDHGQGLEMQEELVLDTGLGYHQDVAYFQPLLMVKDFDQTGFGTDDTFMTNADVPTMAVEGLIQDPVNPFTGEPINSDEKTAHDQLIIVSDQWGASNYTGSTFLPSTWIRVRDNIWDAENWAFSDTETVLKEHTLP